MNKIFYLLFTGFIFCNCNKQLKEVKASGIVESQYEVTTMAVNPNSLEPVVFSLALNFLPSQLVAFKSDGLAWTQIPVQVDERAMIDITKPYGEAASGYVLLNYTDANWRTGADVNTLIDSDDEIALMLKDAGSQYAGIDPIGTIAGTKKEVSITDATGTYYVYLFKQDGTLQQNAGINYVQYSYAPTGTFNYGSVRNNENSFITTAKYKWHFSAEWISDQLLLNNVDIFDRHKMFFDDGVCNRSENTFSDGSNAFVCNRVGPIRAIRSYMGANSGPYTQRTHLFYEGRQDIITDLRVHPIYGIHDVFDYSPAANGMKYTNSYNTTQKTIDGVNETLIKGDIQWELVTGNLGSLVILHRRYTDFLNQLHTSYWDDNKTKPRSNCTGDGQAWGTSGVATGFNTNLYFTEPIKGGHSYTSPNFRVIKTFRTIYFEQPNLTNETAINYNSQQPLIVTWQ